MPRPKLSPLSALLPQKGAATQPEPILRASDLEVVQASKHDSSPAPKPRPAKAATSHKDGSRSAVSFRMPEGLQERLRLYAFETRRSKQDILDDALHEYLNRAGY